MGITVSAITSQLQWHRSRTGCIAVTTYVWLMLNQTYVTGSDILSHVEIQLWRHKTWDESDVIKFARNVNWISAHWLNKASPEEYEAAFLKIVSFTFCICILSDFFHILDQWKVVSLTRVIKVYPTYMLFTPINGKEDGKSGLCEFCNFSQ